MATTPPRKTKSKMVMRAEGGPAKHSPPSTLKKIGILAGGLFGDAKSKVKNAGKGMNAGATRYNNERMDAAETGRKMNMKKPQK